MVDAKPVVRGIHRFVRNLAKPTRKEKDELGPYKEEGRFNTLVLIRPSLFGSGFGYKS